MSVQARERQRREEQERREREAAEAERQRKEEEEARERAAQEAAEKQAALAKIREEKAQSLGQEPEKGPNVTRVMFIKVDLVFYFPFPTFIMFCHVSLVQISVQNLFFYCYILSLIYMILN